MASTRNKNTPGNYALEKDSYLTNSFNIILRNSNSKSCNLKIYCWDTVEIPHHKFISESELKNHPVV